jgi:hypothetical protein
MPRRDAPRPEKGGQQMLIKTKEPPLLGDGSPENCQSQAAKDNPKDKGSPRALQAPATLERLVFQTSRLAEFCSQKELVNQTGHGVDDWPLVILKEAVDNAIDSCEEGSIAPAVEIAVTDSGISIADNGPGIAPETIASILDFTTRTSSREAYVSPTRGAQGNALKTLLAMPFALDGGSGETVIESQGVAHRISFSIDPIRQMPRIVRVCEPSSVKTGSRFEVAWSVSASSILYDAHAGFLQVAEDYTWINPHLSLSVDWDRADSPLAEWTAEATDPAWRKWRPSDPTSPHWYDEARLGRLIANNIAHAEDRGAPCRTVADFVREFRGLSGTAKARQITDAVSASRLSLADFYGDGAGGRVGALLAAMRQHSRPIKPRDLGIIGEAHLRAKFEAAGAAPESFAYKRSEIEHEGVPYLAECAFGFCPEGADERRIITGVNWSVSIGGDPFRHLGGLGQSLGSILTNQRAGPDEPIVTVLHLACPRVEYLDRGKSSVRLPSSPAKAIAALVEGVTAKWAKQRRAEERDSNARLRRLDRMVGRPLSISLREAAWDVMEDAYTAASAGGTLPANPRQIMYAARPEVLRISEKTNLDSQYFCQTLLPDYIRENPETCASWDIAWDDRGHFTEPHTKMSFGIGTLNVRDYTGAYSAAVLQEAGFGPAKIATSGPASRYDAMLYIEKEGFTAILERARIAEKFDIAIMSCKGMSVTAARMLIDQTCARYHIPLLILHDFDVSGFSIAQTLCNDTRRFSFSSEFKTIDLGLRLADVEQLGLESEPVSFGKTDPYKIDIRLHRNGATAEEKAFLMEGQRVELNAMTSDQFVAFVERKLTEAGIAKVVPPADQLAKAFSLFVRSRRIEAIVDEAIEELDDEEIAAPADLGATVAAYLAAHPDKPWEEAVRQAADDSEDEP